MPTDAERCRDEDVIVVGGGNSAGQAAVHLSRAARSVRVVVRGEALASTMSRYLLERLESRPNIELTTETEISAVHGNGRLEHADLRDRSDGSVERVAVSEVFVMIGAEPCTEAVETMLDLDEAGYIRCGEGAAGCEGPNRWRPTDRQPHLLETVWPGVFAAGDVRAGATNASPAPWATAPWPCASRTRCCRAKNREGESPGGSLFGREVVRGPAASTRWAAVAVAVLDDPAEPSTAPAQALGS